MMSKKEILKEKEIFERYIQAKALKHSEQRERITELFLGIDKHLTLDELYEIVRKKYPRIGYATIYRTMKLLCNSGLCRELKFEDGQTRYEHLYGHQHHDHLICTRCGKLVEIIDPEIERLQDRLFEQHDFHPQRHRLELYGVCKKCKLDKEEEGGNNR